MQKQKLSEELVEIGNYLNDAFPYDTRIHRVIAALDSASDRALTLEAIEGYWQESIDASWKNSATVLKAVLAGVELGKK